MGFYNFYPVATQLAGQTIPGALTITGALTLSTPLSIASGGTGSPAGAALPSWIPADPAYLAWTYDPVEIQASATLLSSGVINLIRVNVRSSITCTNVILFVGTAGVTLTAAENFAGLYNSSGTLIGTSADQSAVWTTAGLYVMALSGGPFVLPAGFYWVAAVSNFTGTGPGLGRTTNLTAPLANAGLANSTARFATNGTGTTLPGSITPASNVQVVTEYWAALS